MTDTDSPLVKVNQTVLVACVGLAVELLVWWSEAGRVFYGRGARDEDDGLRGMVNDAVRALGGWREARRLLDAKNGRTGPRVAPRLHARGIRLREDAT